MYKIFAFGFPAVLIFFISVHHVFVILKKYMFLRGKYTIGHNADINCSEFVCILTDLHFGHLSHPLFESHLHLFNL